MNAEDNHGNTPLHEIAKSPMKCKEMLDDLMHNKPSRYGYKTLPKNFRGETPLHAAASHGRLDTVKFLMPFYARTREGNQPQDNFGNKPIHLSAQNQQSLGVLKYLMNKVSDKEPRNNVGDTPLHIAAANGNLEAVEFLTPIVSNKETMNSENLTALIKAAIAGHLSVVQYLVHYEDDEEEDGNYDYNNGYDDNEIPYEYRFNGGYDIRHVSAANGHIFIVKFLDDIDFVSHPIPITSEGIRPIHLAAEGGYKNVVEHLITRDSTNSEVTTEDNYTPLHYAAKEGHLDIVRYLIEEKNVNPQTKTKDGYTPLYFAACHLKVGMLLAVSQSAILFCIIIFIYFS